MTRASVLPRSSVNAPVYMYRFDARTEVRELMSPHTVEIAYVFDNLELSWRTNGAVTLEKQLLADMVSGAWANFARNGVPSASGLPAWQQFSSAHPVLMSIGDQSHLEMSPPSIFACSRRRTITRPSKPRLERSRKDDRHFGMAHKAA